MFCTPVTASRAAAAGRPALPSPARMPGRDALRRALLPVFGSFNGEVIALRGLDLRRGQAVGAVGALARERRVVESALRRILDHAVLDAVQRVARLAARPRGSSDTCPAGSRCPASLLTDQVQRRCARRALRIWFHAAAPAMMPLKSSGISLRCGQALPAALRAAVVIGQLSARCRSGR